MYDLASAAAVQAARSRIAFYQRGDDAVALYEALPDALKSRAASTTPGSNGAHAGAGSRMPRT